MFDRLKAWRQRQQEEKQARSKIQGLRDLVTWRDNHIHCRQEPGYAEMLQVIDHLIDHWPYPVQWD